MLDFTRKIWQQQDKHEGNRRRLFAAVGGGLDATRVLYPGSWADVAASMVFDDVTYVDTDRRAKRFFSDRSGVDELIAAHRRDPNRAVWSFLAQDYASDLDLQHEAFDLLVSLYAGPISAECTQYLCIGGFLLANDSHGDASLASLDDRYALRGAVSTQADSYLLDFDNPAEWLVAEGISRTREEILNAGQGGGFTRSAFAYLFERTG
ncbi:MAG: hypothetical protein ACR2OH_01685 [Microthrixaceae bacterium]